MKEKNRNMTMTVEQLKSLQAKIKRKNKIVNSIFIIIFLIIFTFNIFVYINSSESIYTHLFILLFESMFVYIIAAIIKIAITSNDIKQFQNEYKNTFVLSALIKCFDNVEYEPLKGIDESIIRETGMINTGDRYTSNDYISGTYKNINFIQSDIHIQEKQEIEDSDGNKTTVWETTFLGRWMIFDFNKSFKENICVSSLYNYNLFLGEKYKKVELEDIDFNKQFKVYTRNEHEAFYILTPPFMEKLKNIKIELKCGIMLCFVNNKLHVAISNNKDSFEPNVYKTINEEEIENSITKDIKLITDLVTELNLDNDLFKME